MKLNLFLFLKKAVSHVSVFYVCQPIIFNLFILIILNLVTVSFDFYLAFTAPDEGEFCLTEILGNKIITLLSCPISLAIGFLFYSTLLILIYTKIRLHLATVCPSGPCIELPDLVTEMTAMPSVILKYCLSNCSAVVLPGKLQDNLYCI